MILVQSCESDLTKESENSHQSLQSKKAEMIENFIQFLKAESQTRSRDIMNPDELEFLVEGAFNALHTKADASCDRTTLLHGEASVTPFKSNNTLEDGKALYNILRPKLRETYSQINSINKSLIWIDLEFIENEIEGSKVVWVMKVGQNSGQNLKERSTSCSFSIPTEYSGLQDAFLYIASCAYANVDYEGITNPGQYWVDIHSENIYSTDFGGFHYVCEDIDTDPNIPQCSTYGTHSNE